MSTLTINNVEKIIEICNTYQFGYAGTNPIDSSYNMYIYRDSIDQNENNGLPVLLNTVRINFNSL